MSAPPPVHERLEITSTHGNQHTAHSPLVAAAKSVLESPRPPLGPVEQRLYSLSVRLNGSGVAVYLMPVIESCPPNFWCGSVIVPPRSVIVLLEKARSFLGDVITTSSLKLQRPSLVGVLPFFQKGYFSVTICLLSSSLSNFVLKTFLNLQTHFHRNLELLLRSSV